MNPMAQYVLCFLAGLGLAFAGLGVMIYLIQKGGS